MEPYGLDTKWVKDSKFQMSAMGFVSLGKKAKKDKPDLNMKNWKPVRRVAQPSTSNVLDPTGPRDWRVHASEWEP